MSEGVGGEEMRVMTQSGGETERRGGEDQRRPGVDVKKGIKHSLKEGECQKVVFFFPGEAEKK